MSTENFDNKLRKKVLDFEPEYEEKAWEKFSPRLHSDYRQSYPPFHRKRIGYLIGVAASFIIAFIYFYPIKQKGSPEILPKIVSSPEKEIIKPYVKPQEVEGSSAISASSQIHLPYEYHTVKEKTKRKGNHKQITEKQGINQENLPISFPSNQRDKHRESLVIASVNLPESPSSMKESQAVFDKEDKFSLHPKVITPIHLSEESAIKEDNKPLALYPLTIATPSIACSNAKRVRFRPSVSAAGSITMMEGTLLYSGGFNIGIIPRLSLNLGLGYASTAKMFYKSVSEFNTMNNADFADLVPDAQGFIGTSVAPITDISDRQRQWEIPVSVQYRQPLWKGLSAVVMAGKRFVLDSRQELTYVIHNNMAANTPKEEQKEYSLAYPQGTKINAPFYGGVGISYQWKRIEIAAVPQLILREKTNKGVYSQNIGGINQVSAGVLFGTAVQIF